MKTLIRWSVLATVVAILALPAAAQACPFCSAVSLTFAQEIAQSQAAVIATLKQRFPGIAEPKKADICYATQNRQDAVKFMAPQVDLVIVVGSPNSSNSNRFKIKPV